MITTPQKITLRQMRALGVRGVLIHCVKCSNRIKVNVDQWDQEVRLSDLENQFTCSVCGNKGAEVRADLDWDNNRETI